MNSARSRTHHEAAPFAKAAVAAAAPRLPVLSLLLPVYNEEAVLPKLLARLDDVIAGLAAADSAPENEIRDPDTDIEVIFVNDGSGDGSLALLTGYAKGRPWMRVLSLSRNFGHQIAVTAGMEHARGQAVVILDADLQDPPELLPEMLRLWREGWEVVYALRTERSGETWFKRVSAAFFYRLLRRLTAVDIPADTGDFRLMDRKVVDALNRMGEHHRFSARHGRLGRLQADRTALQTRRARGRAKRSTRSEDGSAAMDAVCSFSHAPLKLATNLGWSIADWRSCTR
jgi:dolichol-phosphate mannosyltransferase